MTDEYHSFMTIKTQYLLLVPQGKNVVKCWWEYKNTFIIEGFIETYNSHLVAKGFSQYNGIFSLNLFPYCKYEICLTKFIEVFFQASICIHSVTHSGDYSKEKSSFPADCNKKIQGFSVKVLDN